MNKFFNILLAKFNIYSKPSRVFHEYHSNFISFFKFKLSHSLYTSNEAEPYWYYFRVEETVPEVQIQVQTLLETDLKVAKSVSQLIKTLKSCKKGTKNLQKRNTFITDLEQIALAIKLDELKKR